MQLPRGKHQKEKQKMETEGTKVAEVEETKVEEGGGPVKSPSETDAEFAARVAGETEKPEPAKLSPRGEMQKWLDKNYRSMSFPAVAEIESLMDTHLGKLPDADAKALK